MHWDVFYVGFQPKQLNNRIWTIEFGNCCDRNAFGRVLCWYSSFGCMPGVVIGFNKIADIHALLLDATMYDQAQLM